MAEIGTPLRCVELPQTGFPSSVPCAQSLSCLGQGRGTPKQLFHDDEIESIIMSYGYYRWQLPSPRAGSGFQTRQSSVRQKQNEETRWNPGEGISQCKLVSFPQFLSSASRYFKNEKPRNTGSHEEKTPCAVNSLSTGPSVFSEASHAVLGWWSNEHTQEGNAEGPFEMLFIFTDISVEVSVGQFHKGTLSLREAALPGLFLLQHTEGKRSVLKSASCRWSCWGLQSNATWPADSWPRWLLSNSWFKNKGRGLDNGLEMRGSFFLMKINSSLPPGQWNMQIKEKPMQAETFK